MKLLLKINMSDYKKKHENKYLNSISITKGILMLIVLY